MHGSKTTLTTGTLQQAHRGAAKFPVLRGQTAPLVYHSIRRFSSCEGAANDVIVIFCVNYLNLLSTSVDFFSLYRGT